MTNRIALLAVMLLSACDCLQSVTGTIVDANSGNPIANALVYKDEDQSVSDSTDQDGKFELNDITGVKNCNTLTLVIEKPGYNSITLTAPNNEDIVVQLSN